MKRKDPHAWIGPIPLGRGSQARSLCKKVTIANVIAVPLDTSDIPVGNGLVLPDWICADCRNVKISRNSKHQYVYAIRDARDVAKDIQSQEGKKA